MIEMRAGSSSSSLRLLLATLSLSLASCGGESTRAAEPASREYKACGCGCCGGATPQGPECVGEAELARIIARDKAVRGSPQCHAAGCSQGVLYKICGPD